MMLAFAFGEIKGWLNSFAAAMSLLPILKAKHEGQVDVAPEHVFTGFQDYTKVFELVDVVLIGTPSGPRPKWMARCRFQARRCQYKSK